MTQWRASLLLFAAVAACLCVLRPLEAANVDVVLNNGVYENLVLGAKQGTAQPDDPVNFITELQSFLDAGSAALHFATDGRASFGGVTLLLPRDWDTTQFSNVAPALPDVSMSSADILLHDDVDTIPDTLQAELCGVPGRQIRIPLPFLALTEEEEKQYGTTGAILAHEWAHYRWGIHDEHGYPGDPVYPGLRDPEDIMYQIPSSCAAGTIEGGWHPGCDSTGICNPINNSPDCKFCFSDTSTAANTQASLGYLPALSLGTFCDSSSHDRESLTPQNVLCGNRSVWEVIAAHPDYTHMSEHDVTPVTIALQEEPLGRVLILLDTPPTTGQVLDYTNLLDEIQRPLTTHKSLQLAIASYRAKSDVEVELYNARPFGVIDDYRTLYDLLPTPETSSGLVPALSMVLQKALEELLQDEYLPGTLIVLPVTNRLMDAAKLDDTTGNNLHIRRIKPLLLFPENSPSLAPAGSFIQQSGARFLYRNDTAGPLNYASVMAAEDLTSFLNQPFTNDHAIVLHETDQLEVGEKYSGTVLYQGNVAQHRLAVITSTGPVSDLKVYYSKYGSMRPCETCTVTDDSVFFRFTASAKNNNPGEEWILEVENAGSEVVDIEITWSEVNYVGVPEEMEVQVWSSDGRGPIASVPENAVFVLYASVTNFGKQVLSSRISVEVFLTLGSMLTKVTLRDDGAGSDIRRDDSVYSYGFNKIGLPDGTVVTIKRVSVSSNIPFTSYKARPAVAGNSKQTLASSGLYTTDPDEQECCGSFVLNPNIDLSHRANGYYVYLWDSFPPIEINRTTEEPTTAEPTTAEPTTAEPTTAEPTTAEPTTADPITAEPTTAEPTTADPTTADPTTAEPTTAEPTTADPTTAEPTTLKQTTPKSTTEEQKTTTDGVSVSAVASAGVVLSIVGVTLAVTAVY